MASLFASDLATAWPWQDHRAQAVAGPPRPSRAACPIAKPPFPRTFCAGQTQRCQPESTLYWPENAHTFPDRAEVAMRSVPSGPSGWAASADLRFRLLSADYRTLKERSWQYTVDHRLNEEFRSVDECHIGDCV